MYVLLWIAEKLSKIKRAIDYMEVLRIAYSFMAEYVFVCVYRKSMLSRVLNKLSPKYTRIISLFDIPQ